MRWTVKPAPAAVAPVAWLWSPRLATVWMVFVHGLVLSLFTAPLPLSGDLELHVVLFAVLGATSVLAPAGRALGWIGEGTDAALSVAALALAGRHAAITLDHAVGLWTRGDGSPPPPLRALGGIGLDVPLVAFGFGIAFSVTTTVADALRRRATPAWARVG